MAEQGDQSRSRGSSSRAVRSVRRLASPAALAALALLAGCGSPPPSNKKPLSATAKGAERIAERDFGRQTVPCSDPKAAARSLLEITSRDLGEGIRTRLLDSALAPVRLRDGPGQVAVIVYSLSPRSDDEVITTTEHFLINQSCQIMSWSSVAAVK